MLSDWMVWGGLAVILFLIIDVRRLNRKVDFLWEALVLTLEDTEYDKDERL